VRVVIKNGDAEVELSDSASFTPTIMRELCDQAVKTYDRAFDDDEPDNVDIVEDTGEQ
jgi:hypothetical protein